ncbi:hypothetical protein ACS126_12555 [Sphingobacterium lactis]|uniref:hypothetical protein n=1 Tax=Sphingobacterium lactis TaxID=797291 RepID=UPI003EC8ADAD
MKHAIPKQEEGKKLDITESKTFLSKEEAVDFFNLTRAKLLNINNWFEIASLPASTFTLLDTLGTKKEGPAEEGDYIQIDIPGPGLWSTGGYDYVRVEQIDESREENTAILTMRLRPSTLPNPEDDLETKHFFNNMSSSTFQIKRVGNLIEASYFGRNELMNMELDSLADKIRNIFVALGAKLGSSFPQWKALIHGLLDLDEDEKK